VRLSIILEEEFIMAEPGEEFRFRRYKGAARLWQDVLLIFVPVKGIISTLTLS